MNKQNQNEVRPLARVLARELSPEEVRQVAGGCNTTGNGNSGDCTTGGGGGITDRDHAK